MRYADLFQQSLAFLGDASRSLEIEILLEKAFGLTRPGFWANKNEKIHDRAASNRFQRWLKRLIEHEPLSYIIGEKEFYSHHIIVDRHVLIPRPETEHLVEAALEILHPGMAILDIGAGSGIISIVLGQQSGCHVTALDCSRRALRNLQKNIDRYGLSKSISPIHGNLFPRDSRTYNLIVSNPPYLSLEEWQTLPPNIRCFEPKRALLAGPRGTEVIERIIHRSPHFLAKGGILILEVGAGQKERVDSVLSSSRFQKPEWRRDYQGIDRIVIARS